MSGIIAPFELARFNKKRKQMINSEGQPINLLAAAPIGYAPNLNFQDQSVNFENVGVDDKLVVGDKKDNQIELSGANTGSSPTIIPSGIDAAISLNLAGKGAPVTVDSGSVLKVLSTIDTNSSTTGSIQCQGGIMAAKALYNGGDCYFNRTSANFFTLQGAATGQPPHLTASSLAGGDANVNMHIDGKGTGGIRIASHRGNYANVDGSDSGTKTVTYGVGPNSADTDVDVIIKPKGNGNIRVPALWSRAFVSGLTQTIAAGASAEVTLTGMTGLSSSLTLGTTRIQTSGGTNYTQWQIMAVIRFTFDTAGPCYAHAGIFGNAFGSGQAFQYLHTTASSTTKELSIAVNSVFYSGNGNEFWFRFYNDSSAGIATITAVDMSLLRVGAN
jgi:hypothetical protein